MIVIDGIIFSLQTHGGISVYFRTLLDYLKSRRVPATLTLDTPVKQEVNGDGTQIAVMRRRTRFLERTDPAVIPRGTTVFHSSYYRQPCEGNLPTVMTVHDFIFQAPSARARCWGLYNAGIQPFARRTR